MTRALLVAAVALSLAAFVAAAGPREETPAGPAVGPASAPAVVPAVLTPLSLSNGAPGAPSAALPAAPGFSATALPPSAAAAQASAAAPQPAQAAPASPPAGPPNGPRRAAAPPSGPPPGGPGRAPDADAPPPGPAGVAGEDDARERAQQAAPPSRAAFTQLKAELAALEKEQRRLNTASARIAVGQKDAPSVDAMNVADEARRKADALRPQIQAKRDAIARAKDAERARYRSLKDEAASLKREREQALAAARSGVAGHEYKGGADEARARALEQASELQTRLAAKKKALALMERDNPGLAGVRAPLVAARNALGLAPRTDQEKALSDEIRTLDASASAKEAHAQGLFDTGRQHPDIGAQEEGMKYVMSARKDREAAAAKRKELAALTGRR